MTPKDHISHLLSYSSESHTQGAVQKGDPVFVEAASPFFKTFEIFMSPTLKLFPILKTLAGFRSLWMIWLWCKYFKAEFKNKLPSETSLITFQTVVSGIRFFFYLACWMRVERSPESAYSIKIYNVSQELSNKHEYILIKFL